MSRLLPFQEAGMWSTAQGVGDWHMFVAAEAVRTGKRITRLREIRLLMVNPDSTKTFPVISMSSSTHAG